MVNPIADLEMNGRLSKLMFIITNNNGGMVGAVVRSLPSNHKASGSNPCAAEC